jgi:hypothetical protein
MSCEGVTQGFEEPNFGAKLVVDGHTSDISLMSDGFNAEARESIAGYE